MRRPDTWRTRCPRPSGAEHIRSAIEAEVDTWLAENPGLASADSSPELMRDLGAALEGSGIADRVQTRLGLRQHSKPGICANTIDYFNGATCDPDKDISVWLREGAPLGIDKPITSRGIFPPCHAAPEEYCPDPRLEGSQGWSYYASATAAPSECQAILDKMVSAQWACEYKDWDSLRSALGSSEITVNKLGLISKLRPDGTMKRRIIWDMSEWLQPEDQVPRAHRPPEAQRPDR